MRWTHSWRPKFALAPIASLCLSGAVLTSPAMATDYYQQGRQGCAPCSPYAPRMQHGPVYQGPMQNGQLQPLPMNNGVAPQSDDPAPQPPTDNQSFDSPSFMDPSASASSMASLSPGANTPMLGRNDQSNRLNLFDNMSAAPATRVWFGLQYADQFDTGVNTTTGFDSFYSLNSAAITALGNSRDDVLRFNEGVTSEYFLANQVLYRAGMEYALNCNFSMAVQGQYVSPTADGDPTDEWTNPQVMFKYVLSRDCDTILSATFGVTPNISTGRGAVNEDTTKLYPGLLYYEAITPNWFYQGGIQFGVPTEGDQVATFDWSASLGFWLYRHPSLGSNSCGSCGAWLTGIVPQINLLGKHVIGDNTIVGPFGFQGNATTVRIDDAGLPGDVVPFVDGAGNPLGGQGFLIYNEPDNVVDLTLGTHFYFGSSVQIGVGYSLPLTDDSVRENEFVTTFNYLF